MPVSKFTPKAGPEPALARAALYLSSAGVGAVTAQTADLMACARQAERAGLRIVTLAGDDDPGDGLGGSNLRCLIDRLGQGEFEVIVAHIGETMITINAPRLDAQETVH